MARKGKLEEMKEKRGYLLNGHVLLSKYDPKVLKAYDKYYSTIVLDNSLLDRKTKELLIISVLAARGLFEPLAIHARRAIEAGAKDKEIVEALEIAGLYAGAPSMLYALQAINPRD